MDTTIVLSMRSLTTLPTRTLRRARADSVVEFVIQLLLANGRPGSRLHGGRAFLLTQDREQPRHLATPGPDLEWVVELLHRIPEAQVEQLLAQLRHTQTNLVLGHVPHAARLGQ